MAMLLRSPVGQLALRRFAPSSSAAASRLFSNIAAISRNNNDDLEERIDELGKKLCQIYARRNEVEADLIHLLRQSRAETRHPDDSRVEEAKEELLQLYLRQRPVLAVATVEADLAHLLRQFEARSQHRLSGDTAAASLVKDDSDWRDSCESMEPEEFSTEPYVGESDCASGYCFSGGSYTAESYSGDMFWEMDTRER